MISYYCWECDYDTYLDDDEEYVCPRCHGEGIW